MTFGYKIGRISYFNSNTISKLLCAFFGSRILTGAGEKQLFNGGEFSPPVLLSGFFCELFDPEPSLPYGTLSYVLFLKLLKTFLVIEDITEIRGKLHPCNHLAADEF